MAFLSRPNDLLIVGRSRATCLSDYFWPCRCEISVCEIILLRGMEMPLCHVADNQVGKAYDLLYVQYDQQIATLVYHPQEMWKPLFLALMGISTKESPARYISSKTVSSAQGPETGHPSDPNSHVSKLTALLLRLCVTNREFTTEDPAVRPKGTISVY